MITIDRIYAVIEDGTAVITTARGMSGNRPWVVVPEPRKKIVLAR